MPSLVIFILLICGLSGNVYAADKPPTLSTGQKIYNERCYFCHGYAGDAQTVAASFLVPPPVNFTRADAKIFTPAFIVSVLRKGEPSTAMQSFAGILTEAEMEQVAQFVVDAFVQRNNLIHTYYHTTENGWPDHQRYADAFPFATGKISMNQAVEKLTPAQLRGRDLFLSGCVICHNRGDDPDTKNPVIWEARPLSYPRNHYLTAAPEPKSEAPKLDAMTSASPYLLHDIPPSLNNPSPTVLRGQKLFQDNCAFCHAADGTGKNWIGSFLEPHPRNLRDPAFMKNMSREKLATTIREGVLETSMPAWKSVLSEAEIAAIVTYIAEFFYPIAE